MEQYKSCCSAAGFPLELLEDNVTLGVVGKELVMEIPVDVSVVMTIPSSEDTEQVNASPGKANPVRVRATPEPIDCPLTSHVTVFVTVSPSAS